MKDLFAQVDTTKYEANAFYRKCLMKYDMNSEFNQALWEDTDDVLLLELYQDAKKVVGINVNDHKLNALVQTYYLDNLSNVTREKLLFSHNLFLIAVYECDLLLQKVNEMDSPYGENEIRLKEMVRMARQRNN